MTTRSSVKKITSKKTVVKKLPTPAGNIILKSTIPKKTKTIRQTISPALPMLPAQTLTIKNISKRKTLRPEFHTKRQPLGHLLLEKKLRASGFRGAVSSNKDVLEKYSYDESIFSVRPQVVIQPKDTRDVETAVRLIAIETITFPALSLTPRAAGTGLSGGSLTDSVMLDVTKYMTHIGSYSSRTNTFTCGPGAMWRDVEKMLKRHDRYLPSYPASKDICSLGGAIANNSAGPDSLRFGHCAAWVESLEVTLFDGYTYTLAPLSFTDFEKLLKKDNAHATIAREVFSLLEKNEKMIADARPHTKKNSAGYALWDVLSTSVSEFKKGQGTFDLTRIISGSQGTIGIITSITMRTEPIAKDSQLIVVPIFDLMDASTIITRALKYDPRNIELFDGLTFDLALKNPAFFKDRLGKLEYYQVMLAMYTTYHVRYNRKTPEFFMLITLDKRAQAPAADIVKDLQAHQGKRARLVRNPMEVEMFWQIRRASYTLSKLQDLNKRPAAFLEDMTVPAKNLSKFFFAIKKLLKKYNVQAAVHGHGGDGHLHFYPLIDFTNKTTPQLIEKMSEEFFATAVKFDGNICGEHNDGIIRTPHLSKIFSKQILDLFIALEYICDPSDIFNPGKKVNPRFDVKTNLRQIN